VNGDYYEPKNKDEKLPDRFAAKGHCSRRRVEVIYCMVPVVKDDYYEYYKPVIAKKTNILL